MDIRFTQDIARDLQISHKSSAEINITELIKNKKKKFQKISLIV